MKSYLVALGFSVNQPQLNQFNKALADTAAMVERRTAGMVKSFATVGAAAVGAFSSIGLATVGLMDKVADSEMGFQLYATKMYMSVDAAKRLKVATDALGYSIDEIAWNPELRQRFGALMSDQTTMQRGLGGDYKDQMKYIRDVKFEFTRLRVEFEYLAMGVVKNLVKGFGSSGDILAKLKQFNQWLIDDLPQLAQRISTSFTPVLKDTVEMGRHLWQILQDITSSILQFMGALYNDNALKSGKVNIENIALAAQHVADSINKILSVLQSVVGYIKDHPIAAKMFGGALIGGAVGGPWGAAIGAVAGAGIGTGQYLREKVGGPTFGGASTVGWQPGKFSSADLGRVAAMAASQQTGIPFELIYGQLSHETGGFKNRGALNLNNFAGIRIPGSKEYRSFSSSEDFAQYYSGLIRNRYPEALKAQTPEQFAWALKNGTIGSWYEDSYSNYASGIRRNMPQGNTYVGDINVHVSQSNATPQEIAKAVRSEMQKGVQRNIAQGSGVYAY